MENWENYFEFEVEASEINHNLPLHLDKLKVQLLREQIDIYLCRHIPLESQNVDIELLYTLMTY